MHALSQPARIRVFKAALEEAGYDVRHIATDYSFANFGDSASPTTEVPLAAFDGYPFTYRNACIGVVFRQHADSADAIHQYMALGAPLVFEVSENSVQPWRIGPKRAVADGKRFRIDDIESVFRAHRSAWNPSAIGRLKSASDVRTSQQLDFYDAGLLPVLEQFFQSKLKDLLERAFSDTAECFRSVHGRDPEVSCLFPFLFRFVTAKIFMDRADAKGWENLSSPKQILNRAEAHSGSGLLNKLPKEFLDGRILTKAWESISRSLHFENLSVPDLVGIYEDLFIDDTARRNLGVHGTPVALATYVINQMPWETVPVDERVVLEPFCGHGVFLAQAMERLGRDLNSKLTPRQRHEYFRKRLIGVEKDPLAIEVCRLLLTLADYPNDNSWQLHQSDVFEFPEWDSVTKLASAVVANPPYESFSSVHRSQVRAVKAHPPAEFIHRLMDQPPKLLGLILPQSFLSSPSYQDANRKIAQRYSEVSVVELPKLFKYADNETVAILGSGLRNGGERTSVHYSEVLPTGVNAFYQTGEVSHLRAGKLKIQGANRQFTLWIPPKGSLFTSLPSQHCLGDLATGHKGINWKPRRDGLPRTRPRTDTASDATRPGFLRGVEKMSGNLSQFQIKQFRFLSLLEQDQSKRDKAWKLDWQSKKVVCNAARFERKSPWRLAGWADSEGLVFTKQFLVFWPAQGISEFALAAVLSSPLASAFCFERDLGIDNRISTLSHLPVPSPERLQYGGPLHEQAKLLQEVFASRDFGAPLDVPRVMEAVLRLDSLVLAAYELPARVERELLNQFHSWRRPISIPFFSFFPDHFTDPIRLHEFVSIQYEWDHLNERRCNLIEKEVSKTRLTAGERDELDRLQNLADLLIRLKNPYPLDETAKIISELKSKGKWKFSI